MMYKVMVIEDGSIHKEDNNKFQDFIKNERFIHFIAILNPPRPGVEECHALLEFRHYQPGTPRNELFIMRIVEWSDMAWGIVSIPIEEKAFMEKVADECGLRIAVGVPTMVSENGFERFPADNPRTFSLENKSGSLVYRNDPEITRKLLEAEKETIARLQPQSEE